MTRFVLRYTGDGEMPASDVQRIVAQPGLSVLDQSSRMLFVEMPDEIKQALASSVEHWSISREHIIPLPDAKPRLKKSKDR